MDDEEVNIRPLLHVGGSSTRIETPKELLESSDGRSAFDHALETLHSAVPAAKEIYVSFHDRSQLEAMQPCIDSFTSSMRSDLLPADNQHHGTSPPKIIPIFDDHGHRDIGPAAGLLAAYKVDPDATWLVLGCAYPLLPPSALQQLILEYAPPVSCFLNAEGYCEPLVALWGPHALYVLQENVQKGMYGLNRVVKETGGKLVTPLRGEWVTAVNAVEGWEDGY